MPTLNPPLNATPPADASLLGLVDVHCHCLPGLDDGPQDMDESLALCRVMVEQGVRTVVATPHQLGAYELSNTVPRVMAAVHDLQAALQAEQLPLTVLPGGDVHLDHRLDRLVLEEHVLTLADGRRWLMLEMPQEQFVDITALLHRLSDAGVQCLLSHPERYAWIQGHEADIINMRMHLGLRLQITAGSLLGDFGDVAGTLAWKWLEQGQADVVAGDAHALSLRPPRLRAAHAAIAARCGLSRADQVCLIQPLLMIAA